MANIFYNNAKEILFSGSLDFSSDTFKLALVDSTYTPNIDTDIYYDDISGEIENAGYTTGGALMDNTSLSIVSDVLVYDADNLVWIITGTVTIRGGVLYKDTGDSSTSPLICYYDFLEDNVVTNGTFTIRWASNGAISLTSE